MLGLTLLNKVENNADVQKLLENCNDYLFFQDGEPVGENAAISLFDEFPETAEPNSKLIIGIYYMNRLLGVFDLITNFPISGVLNLGLMLLEPTARKQGIGTRAYYQLEEWATSHGYQRIRLGVLLDNIAGQNFWSKNGFVGTGEIKLYKVKQFQVMEKAIG